MKPKHGYEVLTLEGTHYSHSERLAKSKARGLTRQGYECILTKFDFETYDYATGEGIEYIERYNFCHK